MSEDPGPYGDEEVEVPQISLEHLLALESISNAASKLSEDVKVDYDSLIGPAFMSKAVKERGVLRKRHVIDFQKDSVEHNNISHEVLDSLRQKYQDRIPETEKLSSSLQSLVSAVRKIKDAADDFLGYFSGMIDELKLRRDPGIPFNAFAEFRSNLSLQRSLSELRNRLRYRGSRQKARGDISGFMAKADKVFKGVEGTARAAYDEGGHIKPVIEIEELWDEAIIYRHVVAVYDVVRNYNAAVAELARDLPQHEHAEAKPELRTAVADLNRHLALLSERPYSKQTIEYVRLVNGAASVVLDALCSRELEVNRLLGFYNVHWRKDDFAKLAEKHGFEVFYSHRKFSSDEPEYATKRVSK